MAVDFHRRAKKLWSTNGLASWMLVLLPAAALTSPLFGQAKTDPAKTDPAKPCATPPCSRPDTQQPTVPAQQFPYPGEPGTPKAAPPSALNPDVPSAPVPSGPASAAPKSFPYPGEVLPSGDAGASSSSSSSSSADPNSDSSPNSDPAPDTPPAPSGRRKLPKVKKLQNDEDRAAEDLTVARFYRGTGNWNAAYQRSKDAVKLQPDDPEAHLLLAETALKLNKPDEAAAAYTALLKLDASEDQIKAARKGLAHLKP